MSLTITNSIIILLLVPNVSQKSPSQYHPTSDYCKLNCKRRVHVVCERKHHCGAKEGCKIIPMTPEYREEILDRLNQLRESIASGKLGSNYGNKGATNMNAWSYDLELEYFAGCLVNTCEWRYDLCRKSQRFSVGQLVNRKKNEVDFKFFVDIWAASANFVTQKMIRSFYWGDRSPGCASCFTALAWADVKYVGCALAHSHRTNMVMIVCNHAPHGNDQGHAVYEMARYSSEIASNCRSGIRNDKYPSLCGKIDPIPLKIVDFGTGRPGGGSVMVDIISSMNLSAIAVLIRLIS